MIARDEVLARRARQLARSSGSSVRSEVALRVVVVEAGGQRLGLPVDALRQVVPLPPLTPLTAGSTWLRGLAQVRGELLGVVDLAGLLGLPPRGPCRSLAVVVPPRGPGPFGLAFEAVLGFREIRGDELAPELIRPERPIAALTRDLVAVLDPQRLAAAQGAPSAVDAP